MKTVFLMVMIVSSISFANRESGGRGRGTAVYVDFRSFGTGIDGVTAKRTQQLINEAKMNGQVIDQTFEQKGREGETLICVELTDAFLRYHLVKALAPLISADKKRLGRERTVVYVGNVCGDVSHATEQNIEAYLKP